MDDIAQLIAKLIEYFGLWAVPLFIALYVLLYPEKAKILSSWIWELFSKVWKTAQYKSIGNELEGNIGVFVDDLNKEMSGVKMKSPKICFVHEETRDAFIKKNRVIIKLKPKEDQDFNFAVASYLFVKQTTIPTAKKALSPEMGESIDLYMGRKFLEKRRRSALDSYLEEFYLPQVRNNQNMQNILEDFEQLDDYGLFSRILLQELLFLEKKVVGKTNIVNLEKEFNDLKEFVLKIVKREVREKVPLFFDGRITNTAIILVAITARREQQGTKPYVSRFRKNINEGANHIYFIAWSKSVRFLGEVINEINQSFSNVKLRKVSKYKISSGDNKDTLLKVASYEVISG